MLVAASILNNKRTRQILIWSVVSLVAVALLIYIYGKVKAVILNPDRAEETLTFTPANLTISDNEARALADRLEQSMNGTGTQSQSVIDSLQVLQTPDDLAKLVQVFGNRENCETLNLGCKRGNLFDWLQWEFYGLGTFGWGGIAGGLYYQNALENELARLGYRIND